MHASCSRLFRLVGHSTINVFVIGLVSCLSSELCKLGNILTCQLRTLYAIVTRLIRNAQTLDEGRFVSEG